MTKFLITGLVIILVAGLSYLYFFVFQAPFLRETQFISPKNEVAPANSSPPNLSHTLSSPSLLPTASGSIENRLENLENKVNSLQSQVDQLKTQGNNQVNLSSGPIFIPLGGESSATSLDYQTSTVSEITFDPSSYGKYSSIQLELSLRVFQGNGTAFARLINVTDNLTIPTSEVSTSSQVYIWVSSNGFSLPSGKKTYRLQIKTTTGYEADVANARLRINY